MMNIKLCGMMRDCDVDYANLAMPEYVGFVFANTRRLISKEQAKAFRENLDKKILAVGVFVNESVEIVANLLNEDIIDIAQLHGEEDADYIAKLKTLSAKKIIKAVKVKNAEDIEKVSKLDVEYLLLDTYKKGVLGGTGETFNWDIIEEARMISKEKGFEDKEGYLFNKPFFLAGGLTVDNIAEAAEVVSPFGLDISTGIETEGYKDKDKMTEVVRRIRHVRE